MLTKELITTKVLNRFNRKIRKGKGCWRWTGAKSNGYGIVRIDNKNYSVRRIAYVIHYGTLKESDRVANNCGVRNCVNPLHLHLATSSNLNPEKVRQIVKLREQGHQLNDLAIRFNVHSSTISRIFNGQIWKHVTGRS